MMPRMTPTANRSPPKAITTIAPRCPAIIPPKLKEGLVTPRNMLRAAKQKAKKPMTRPMMMRVTARDTTTSL